MPVFARGMIAQVFLQLFGYDVSAVGNQYFGEVSTEIIGEKVMEKLKKADEVAYVRFASVYRQFKDINTFMSELNKLLSEK